MNFVLGTFVPFRRVLSGGKTGRSDTNCIECHVSLDVAISFGIQRHRPVLGTIAARGISRD